MGQTAAMALAQGRGDNHLGHFLAENLLPPITKNPFGRRIEFGDATLLIDGHNTIRGGFQDRSFPRFALLQRSLCPLPFQELSDLTSDAAEHFQQCVIRLTNLMAEELHHREKPPTKQDRKREGRVESFRSRNRRAREVLILGYIGNPSGFQARPYPSG